MNGPPETDLNKKAQDFVASLMKLANSKPIDETLKVVVQRQIPSTSSTGSLEDLQRLRASFRLCIRLCDQISMYSGLPIVHGPQPVRKVKERSPEIIKELFNSFFAQAVETVSIVGDLPKSRYGRSFGVNIVAFQTWASSTLGEKHLVTLTINVWRDFFQYLLSISESLNGPQTLPPHITTTVESPLSEAAKWSTQWSDIACIEEMYNVTRIVVEQLRNLFQSPFMSLVIEND